LVTPDPPTLNVTPISASFAATPIGSPHELLVSQRVHRRARGADGVTLGLEPARQVDGTPIVRREPPGQVVVPAVPVLGEAERLRAEDLVDGEAVVHLGEVDLRDRDLRLGERVLLAPMMLTLLMKFSSESDA